MIIWAALKYWAGSTDRSPVEIVSLYGYASTVWIFTSVGPLPVPRDHSADDAARLQWLTLLPFGPLRLFLAFAATSLSLFFLLRNLYPVLSTAPNVSARLLVLVIAGLHLIMGMALWWSFLAGGTGALHTPDVGGGVGGGVKPPLGGGEMDDPAGDALGALKRMLL